MKFSTRLVLGGVLLFSGAGLVCPVQAQDAEINQLDNDNPQYVLRLQYVPAPLMAFWLDPQHHALPGNLLAPGRAGAASRAPAPGATGTPRQGVFVFPKGVERIEARGQNELLVWGTEEGMQQLRSTLAFLDRPLRRVEIEAQFVRVAPEDIAAFGIDFATARGNFNTNDNATGDGNTNDKGDNANGGNTDDGKAKIVEVPTNPKVQVGFVRGNFGQTLARLVAQGRAKILATPRVTAINNKTAIIGSSPAPAVDNRNADDQPQLDAPQEGETQAPVEAGFPYYMEVTPTINNDDTVTVRITVDNKAQENGAQDQAPPPSGLDTIANLRDGETIALGGFEPSFMAVPRTGTRTPILGNIPDIGKLFRNKTADSDLLLVFVTGRIVRRAGEAVRNR